MTKVLGERVEGGALIRDAPMNVNMLQSIFVLSNQMFMRSKKISFPCDVLKNLFSQTTFYIPHTDNHFSFHGHFSCASLSYPLLSNKIKDITYQNGVAGGLALKKVPYLKVDIILN